MAVEQNAEPQIPKWIPTLVVLAAVGGFVSLAWYAYHAGSQSMNENDLPVVEAEKTPLKEKPTDPGGMKFPNQDKTIFETFTANNPQAPAKVERVLPAPEEPMAKSADSSGTTGWVNDKLAKNTNGSKSEQVIGHDDKPIAGQAVAPIVEQPAAQTEEIESYTRPKAEEETVKQPLPDKPFQPPAAKTEKHEAKKEPAKPAEKTATKPAGKGPKVQLGAYRSEKEALATWSALQKKFKELSGKSPVVVKADLGAKGVYYRLRVGGFSDANAAKSFCGALSAKGQACILSAQ